MVASFQIMSLIACRIWINFSGIWDLVERGKGVGGCSGRLWRVMGRRIIRACWMMWRGSSMGASSRRIFDGIGRRKKSRANLKRVCFTCCKVRQKRQRHVLCRKKWVFTPAFCPRTLQRYDQCIQNTVRCRNAVHRSLCSNQEAS